MTTQTQRPRNLPATQPPDPRAVIEQLDKLSQEYGPQALAPLPMIARSMRLAEGVRQARALVHQVVPYLKHLAGTVLGFRTDKDDTGGYPDAVLAECLTEATLRGVSWTGNEFNIIAGRCYITREGYQRLVSEVPGLTDLVLSPGVPKTYDGGGIVPFTATWKLDGKDMSLERQIPVRLNRGMGADAAIGKATRKMLASIFFTCTGSNQSIQDAADVIDHDAPGTAALLASPAQVGQLKSLLSQLDRLVDASDVDGHLQSRHNLTRPDLPNLSASDAARLIGELTSWKETAEKPAEPGDREVLVDDCLVILKDLDELHGPDGVTQYLADDHQLTRETIPGLTARRLGRLKDDLAAWLASPRS